MSFAGVTALSLAILLAVLFIDSADVLPLREKFTAPASGVVDVPPVPSATNEPNWGLLMVVVILLLGTGFLVAKYATR